MFDEYFLYPLWLGLIPVGLLILLGIYHYQQHDKKRTALLESLVDKSLQRFVISTPANTKKHQRFFIYAAAGLLAILALAGPTLYKEKVPLFESHQGLVIALDLSTSMLAEDIKPSRMKRAKLAMIELLNSHQTEADTHISYDGYVGLIVFAADAFVLSPLTSDVETIISQLTHMSPVIMPAQGSRLDNAINQATTLLVNAGYIKGDVLLVTDGLSDLAKTEEAAQTALNKGFNLSILAIGSEQGSTIPNPIQRDKSSPFLLDPQGKPVIAILDTAALKRIAKMGKGRYINLSNDANAIKTLLKHYRTKTTFTTNEVHQGEGQKSNLENTIEYKVNAGIWLLLPLLGLILFSWHKGLIGLLCFVVLSPVEPVYAFDWDSLWLNQQQLAKKILDEGKASEAQALFNDPQWKASAAYHAQNYPLAEQLFSQGDSVNSWYNKGNALLKMQQTEQAIEAYHVVLKRQPKHTDASYNLQLALKLQDALSNASPDDNFLLQTKESTDDSTSQNSKNIIIEIKQPQPDKSEQKDPQEKEQKAYEKQWLKSIPDDPSGLWRKKFKHQYQQRNQQQESKPW